MPVNLRPAGASLPAGLGNEFGLASLRSAAHGEPDPSRRQARVKVLMDQIKSSREGVFVHAMLELMGQIPAAAQNAWIDAFADTATAIVTNVSGPRHRVQIAGTPVAGMLGWMPVEPRAQHLQLCRTVRVGLASDAHLLPDHDHLLALLDDEVGALGMPTASSGPPETSGS